MCFQTIIKPFLYPHAYIYSLPISLLTILDSPVPVLIGINKSIDFIEDLEISDPDYNKKDSFIVYDIDN